MTEKIARRGVKTPASYKPDVLEQFTVKDVIGEEGLVISEDNRINEVREWLKEKVNTMANYFVIVNNDGAFSGIISSSNLFSEQHDMASSVSTLIKRKAVWIKLDQSLKTSVELMVTENIDLLPVVDDNLIVIGVISYKDILNAYKISMTKHVTAQPSISFKRQTMKLLLKGKRLITMDRNK